GAELDRMFSGDREPPTPPPAPRTGQTAQTLGDRRAELDRLLRAELESQGLVVTGREIARVVGASVGKDIEWAG
ncbi:MAG TPA: hypothetical protein VJS20_07135, partial [Gemmatimonadales bacterium]|nr:hypothetical protein [Gemmatimonadales bacterium]